MRKQSATGDRHLARRRVQPTRTSAPYASAPPPGSSSRNVCTQPQSADQIEYPIAGSASGRRRQISSACLDAEARSTARRIVYSLAGGHLDVYCEILRHRELPPAMEEGLRLHRHRRGCRRGHQTLPHRLAPFTFASGGGRRDGARVRRWWNQRKPGDRGLVAAGRADRGRSTARPAPIPAARRTRVGLTA